MNLYISENPEALIWLLTIKTGSNESTHVANNLKPIVSRGKEFVAWPFSLTLAVDDGERLPVVKLLIDNVDRRIIETLRIVSEPPEVKLELVVAALPDAVELVIDFLVLTDIEYNATTITGSLQSNNVLSRKYPASRYDPVEFPSLFY